MHKVIHLVVDIFEQGLETSSAECPLIQERQGFIEWTGCWPQLDRRVWSVVVKMLASVFDLMLGHFVIGRWLAAFSPADGAAHSGDDV